MVTKEEPGQLSTLYLKWKEDPILHDQEIAETVDKIIYSTLQRESLNPIYKKFEDREDLLQDLRLLCLKNLNKISNPTNKRIFNFLRVSIKFALRDKARKVGKLMDREEREADLLGEKIKTPDICFFFDDPALDKVAILLSEGYTKDEVKQKLGLTRAGLNKYIKELKRIYNEKGTF